MHNSLELTGKGLELTEYLFVYKVRDGSIVSPGKPFLSSGESVLIFLHGYAIYFMLVAAADYMVTSMGGKTSFAFVFEREWSRGVNLFSLWAAAFIVSIAFCVVNALRRMLARTENSVAPRGRTIIKVMDNVICYLAGFALIFFILYLFGVQGVVLVAVASSISMALGFGARNLASDFLVGMFIVLEDSVHVGDKVRFDQSIGYVTNMNLRTIEITDENQSLITVNNRDANRIINLSKSQSTCLEESEGEKEEISEKNNQMKENLEHADFDSVTH